MANVEQIMDELRARANKKENKAGRDTMAEQDHNSRLIGESGELGNPAPEAINDLFYALENGDGYDAVTFLYNLADSDLDPSYAEELIPHKDLIIRGLLQWAKDEEEWAPTVLTAIDTLRDIGLIWPELSVIYKSALTDYSRLTEANPYAKQDAESAARQISAALHKHSKRDDRYRAMHAIDWDAMVYDMRRGYMDLIKPILDHNKRMIIGDLLRKIKMDPTDTFPVQHTLDALDYANVQWPELDIIKRSFSADSLKESAGIAESTMDPHQLRYITQTLDNHSPWKAADAMIQQGLRYDSNAEIKALWDANKDRTIVHMLKLIKADPNHKGIPLMIKDFKTIGLPWSELDIIKRSFSADA